MKKLSLFVAILFISVASMGAPNPITIEPVDVKTQHGFSFDELKTSWFRSPPPPGREGIAVLFRAPQTVDGFQALMTVRIDKQTGASKNIKNYVKNWIGDYSKLGYEILGSRAFKVKGETAYVIDTKNPESKRQVRQFVFYRPENAVILTCIDTVTSFKDSLKECNKITQSFTWNNVPATAETTKSN